MLFSKPATTEPMMNNLVMGKTDVVGMLAYAIHSQFKDDWRREFKRSFGRDPSAQETNIFELGEQTERRKMTYRFLADARVMGTYGELRGSAKDSFVQRVYRAGAKPEEFIGLSGPRAARRMALSLLLALIAGAALPFLFNIGQSRAVLFAASEAIGGARANAASAAP